MKYFQQAIRITTIIKTPLNHCLLLFFVISSVSLISNSSFAQKDPVLSKLVFHATLLSEVPANPQNQEIIKTTDSGALTSNTKDSDNANILKNISQYQSSIEQIEINSGPFAPAITEQLASLAYLYQQLGDYDSSNEKLASAQHILRVNNGLFTLDQISLVQDMIDNYSSQNNFNETDKLQGYLYYLYQRNYSPSSPEMVSATLNWAQWNIDAYLISTTNQSNNSISLGSNSANTNFPQFNTLNDYIAVRDSTTNQTYFVPRDRMLGLNGLMSRGSFTSLDIRSESVNPRSLIEPHLKEARKKIESLQKLAIEPGSTLPTTAAQNLQVTLADIAYQEKNQLDQFENSSGANRRGFNSRLSFKSSIPFLTRNYNQTKERLEAIITTLSSKDAPNPIEISQAILNLADWHLSFEHPQRAFKAYRDAYHTLKLSGMPEHEIYSFLAPQALIATPAFATQPYSQNTTGSNPDSEPNSEPNYKGYIDVAFFYRDGNIKSIDILTTSSNTPKNIRKTLLQHLKTHKFRPTIFQGEIQDRINLQFRIYYNY